MLENRDYRRRNADEPDAQEAPSLVILLMLVNGVAFILPRLFSARTGNPLGIISLKGLQSGEWWTVFTHFFVHGDWTHLLTNMALLFFAGRRVLADIGARHFLYIYLASGWTGAAVTMLLHPQDSMMGASGCVTGIIGAYAALHPRRSVTSRLGPFFPRLQAINLFYGFLFTGIILEIAATATQNKWSIPILQSVSHSAHVAGLLTGWLYARHLAPALKTLYHREDFFPQGLRRRRHEVEALQVSGRDRNTEIPNQFVPEVPLEKNDEEFLREAVDPVLDKLYAHGMGSLTPEEKAVLNEAATRFSKRKPN